MWLSFILVDFFPWVKRNKSGCLLLLLNGSLLEKAESLGKSNSSNNSRCFSRRWSDLGRGTVTAGASDGLQKGTEKRRKLAIILFYPEIVGEQPTTHVFCSLLALILRSAHPFFLQLLAILWEWWLQLQLREKKVRLHQEHFSYDPSTWHCGQRGKDCLRLYWWYRQLRKQLWGIPA